MKVLALVLLCATAYLNNAAPTDPPVDYREMYDRLLMQLINERIVEGEQFLQRVSQQLKEYQTTHKEEDRVRILEDINSFMPALKETERNLETDLKKTDLDMLERLAFENARDIIQLLIKALNEIEKQVATSTGTTKPPNNTEAPLDWRQEFDKLLLEYIDHNIRRADELLVTLQIQLDEYKKTKDKNLAQSIASEVDSVLPLLKKAQEDVQKELKRTDLNHVERYLYEKVNDEAVILIKYYTTIEKEVKGAPFYQLEKFYAPVDRTADIRALEGKFADISYEVRQYESTKSNEAKTKIIADIEKELPKVKALIKDLNTQLETTHGIVERFHLEREIIALKNIEAAYTREEAKLKGSAF